MLLYSRRRVNSGEFFFLGGYLRGQCLHILESRITVAAADEEDDPVGTEHAIVYTSKQCNSRLIYYTPYKPPDARPFAVGGGD